MATFLAAALCLCLMGMMIFQGAQKAQADPLDLTKGSCSVNVELGNAADEEVTAADLDLYYKLYKVADAERQAGYEGYTFAPILAGDEAQFTELFDAILELNDIVTADGAAADQPSATEAYQALAQSAAALIAADGSTIQPQYTASASSPLSNVDPGLYLMVAYGDNLSSDGNVLFEQDGQFVSQAASDTLQYTFLPEMVALPVQSPTGGWTSQAIINLKYETSPLPGTLEITKVLATFEQNDQTIGTNGATVVFSIKGYKTEADYQSNPDSPDYSNIASLDFDAVGVKTVSVEDVPVGLYLVIEEVYEGAAYQLAPGESKTQTAVIEDAATPAKVSFTNTFKHGPGNGNSGGAIVFSFEKGQNGDWVKNDPVIIDHSQSAREGGE